MHRPDPDANLRALQSHWLRFRPWPFSFLIFFSISCNPKSEKDTPDLDLAGRPSISPPVERAGFVDSSSDWKQTKRPKVRKTFEWQMEATGRPGTRNLSRNAQILQSSAILGAGWLLSLFARSHFGRTPKQSPHLSPSGHANNHMPHRTRPRVLCDPDLLPNTSSHDGSNKHETVQCH